MAAETLSEGGRRGALMAGAGLIAAAGVPRTGAAGGSTASPFRLDGRVCVVTGAARGIGRAICVALAQAGADVAGIDLVAKPSPITAYPAATRADLAQTEAMVKQAGRRFVPIVADIRDIAALRQAAGQVQDGLGKPWAVVANAGIQAFKPILDMQDADWRDIIDVNLNGTANTLRVWAPGMAQQGAGRLIVVASMQGRYGTKDGSAYSASKWGIIGLMKSAALELGKHKVTVNAIIPGLVDTPLTRNPTRWSKAMGEVMANPPKDPTEQQVTQARLPRVPLQVPWLQPEEVAPAAVFLASDAARMVTGATYDVTAGDSAHDAT